jgi:Uma2 family endonuclease
VVAGPAKRGATYRDLEELPDTVIGQIVDGDLYASPNPGAWHQYTSMSLLAEIGLAFHKGRGGPGGWWVLRAVEVHFAMDVVVPDVAGWRRERMPELPRTPAIELPPDWVCEVLSPSTQLLDRGPKLRLYGRVGVRHLWFVDPIAQTLEILRHERDGWLVVETYGGDEKVRAEPFDAVALDLSGWWARGDG